MRPVFLAYSSKDVKEAARIVEALTEMGVRIWWDLDIPARSEWAMEIGRALKRCDTMIVLVTPSAVDSDLVTGELKYAISHVNYRGRVFPVLIEPTPEVPTVFSMLDVFDLTRDSERGLRSLAKTIKKAQREAAAQRRPAARQKVAC
ncbi:MAG: toll/interleukin-1 receptor domain-containing protein [Planctomycetes bacterium]|nr:toll/interleukin-1 receptor domain-containing protein [Planctomycetota bacterium]